MGVPLLDLQAQYRAIRREVEPRLLELVESQRFILGAPVDRLEREIAQRVGVPHAIGCASGTDALLLPLRALELPAGTGVVVPAFTFFATAGAVWNAGLRPVFCDVDAATFNVTAATLEAALAPDVRAVIPVHLFGQMTDMAAVMDVARARGLAVLEDAAQSLGAAQRIGGEWREAGGVGTFGCYSFFPSKNLGGFGDGGMITTADATLDDRLRRLRVHGGLKMYHHEMVGTNSRLDALQAVVLSAKLPHLDGWAESRRGNAAAYAELLAGLEPDITLPTTLPDNRHVFNQFTIRARDRDDLKRHLDASGIGNAIYYPVPLHLQQCFVSLGYRAGSLPVSEHLADEVISLPVYPELTRAQLEEVASAVRGFYRG